MNQRSLWAFAGTCLWASACVPSDASRPLALNRVAPDNWVCDISVRPNKGECDNVAIQASLPDRTNEVRHLVAEATFRITTDRPNNYSLQLTSAEWLPQYLKATLKWEARDDGLMPDTICKSMEATRASEPNANTTSPEKLTAGYSRFYTSEIPLHLKPQGNGEQTHSWQIFPIGDVGTDKSHSYCLMFWAKDHDGGSHDGAVHGEG